MGHCSKRVGEAYFRTPRTTITAFLNFLSVMEQNQRADWRHLLGGIPVVKDEGPDTRRAKWAILCEEHIDERMVELTAALGHAGAPDPAKQRLCARCGAARARPQVV